MKIKFNPMLVCMLLAYVLICPAQANRAQALQTVMKILIGGAAAGALANGSEANALHDQKISVVERMKKQGVDLRDGAIFSTYFSLNNSADAVYWADTISKPDIYMIVSIEGHGDYLVPNYVSEYAGQPILENIFAKKIEPGRKIVVCVLDEDSTSDKIWNNVLQTKVSFNASADISVSKPIKVSVGSSGAIQLVDQQLTLDSPEFVAVAEFVAPDTTESVWMADGVLKDQHNREVGRIQFSQIWKADPAAIDAAESDVITSGKSKIFWFGLAAVLVLVFGKLLFSPTTKAA